MGENFRGEFYASKAQAVHTPSSRPPKKSIRANVRHNESSVISHYLLRVQVTVRPKAISNTHLSIVSAIKYKLTYVLIWVQQPQHCRVDVPYSFRVPTYRFTSQYFHSLLRIQCDFPRRIFSVFAKHDYASIRPPYRRLGVKGSSVNVRQTVVIVCW